MKKIRFLILIVVLLFTFVLFNIHVSAKDTGLIVLEEVEVSISGSDKSDIQVVFKSKEELLDLKVTLTWTSNNQKNAHIVLSSGLSVGETVDVIKNGELIDGYYHYDYILKAMAKISTFGMTFNYVVDGNEYEQYLAITNGNPNISNDIFTPQNAIIIGLIVSIIGVIGTYIIIKSSESNVQMEDESLVKIKDTKGEEDE